MSSSLSHKEVGMQTLDISSLVRGAASPFVIVDHTTASTTAVTLSRFPRQLDTHLYFVANLLMHSCKQTLLCGSWLGRLLTMAHFSNTEREGSG